MSEATTQLAENDTPLALKHAFGRGLNTLPPVIPSAGLSRASSCSDATSEAATHASGGAAPGSQADSSTTQPALQHNQAPRQKDDSSSRPASASASNQSTNGSHVTANPQDCMVAISKYPADLPVSQIQMHAAASATLCGPIQQVDLLSVSSNMMRPDQVAAFSSKIVLVHCSCCTAFQ